MLQENLFQITFAGHCFKFWLVIDQSHIRQITATPREEIDDSEKRRKENRSEIWNEKDAEERKRGDLNEMLTPISVSNWIKNSYIFRFHKWTNSFPLSNFATPFQIWPLKTKFRKKKKNKGIVRTKMTALKLPTPLHQKKNFTIYFCSPKMMSNLSTSFCRFFTVPKNYSV